MATHYLLWMCVYFIKKKTLHETFEPETTLTKTTAAGADVYFRYTLFDFRSSSFLVLHADF